MLQYQFVHDYPSLLLADQQLNLVSAASEDPKSALRNWLHLTEPQSSNIKQRGIQAGLPNNVPTTRGVATVESLLCSPGIGIRIHDNAVLPGIHHWPRGFRDVVDLANIAFAIALQRLDTRLPRL